MNAADRLVHRKVFTHYFFSTTVFSKKQLSMVLMVFAVMLSALGTIYATQTTRTWQAAYQRNVAEEQRLQVEHSQLLLERSAWMAPTRIASLAANRLGMMAASPEATVIVRE